MGASLVTPAEARPAPVLRVVAGGGTDPGDGIPVTPPQLSAVEGVAAWRNVDLVIADAYHNRIRAVGGDGMIPTIAGTRAIGSAGDGGSAIDAQLFLPYAPAATGTRAREDSLDFRTGLMSPRPGVFLLPENSNRRVLEIR